MTDLMLNPKTTSTTFVPLDGMVAWVQHPGGALCASMVASVYSTTFAYTWLALSLDDGEPLGEIRTIGKVQYYDDPIKAQARWENVPPGLHKVTGHWRVNAGESTAHDRERSLVVWESAIEVVDSVNVVRIGDSFAEGYGDPLFAGDRGPLQALLAARSVPFNFVGSRLAGPVTIDPHHEGHPGWRTDQLAGQVSAWFAAYQPKVALISAGTNDLTQSYTGAEHRIGALIDAILAYDPTIDVFASTLPPLTNATFQAERNRVNAALVTVVPAHGGILVDAGDLVLLTDIVAIGQPNEGHPNTTGYAKMAADWDAALQAAGY